MSLTNYSHGITSFGNVIFGDGPGMGEAFYLVGSKVSTDKYWALLEERDVDRSKIFSDLPTAYAAMTGDRNDTLYVFPGTHTQTAKITWAKNSTHLIGVGSPNQRIPATAGTSGCVYFPCTTAMTELFLITGHHCVFANFSTYLSTATGEADIKVNGRNVTLKNIFMKSGQDATQIASAVLGYGLWCDGSAAGYCNGLTVEDCHIGDPRNTVRTAGGMIYMVGNASGNAAMCYEFKRNVIAGWSATDACSAVFESGNFSTDRLVLWEDCTFYNFQTNLGTVLSGGVFTDTSGTTHMNLLSGRTCQYGWEDWSTGTKTYIFSALPAPSAVGGTAIIVTTS